MARQAKTETNQSASEKIQAACSPAAVLEGLLNAQLDMEWVATRLKKYAEEGASPAQMAALKMVMRLMQSGGIINDMRLESQPRPAKEKKTPSGASPTITVVDEVIDGYLDDERNKREQLEEEEEKHAAGIDGAESASGLDQGG